MGRQVGEVKIWNAARAAPPTNANIVEYDTLVFKADLEGGTETTESIKTKLGVADADNDGYLSKEDWNTFNNQGSSPILTYKAILFQHSTNVPTLTEIYNNTGRTFTTGRFTNSAGSVYYQIQFDGDAVSNNKISGYVFINIRAEYGNTQSMYLCPALNLTNEATSGNILNFSTDSTNDIGGA